MERSRSERRRCTSAAMKAALDEVRSDAGARCVLLRGEGKVFCSGADFAAVSGPGGLEFLPAFEAMGKLVLHVGPQGHGSMVKLINNTVAAVNTAACVILIGAGLVRSAMDGFEAQPVPAEANELAGAGALSLFVILRAFSSGCAALTGVEAISDGVPAFKPPEWKNARATLTIMIVLMSMPVSACNVRAIPKKIEPIRASWVRTKQTIA